MFPVKSVLTSPTSEMVVFDELALSPPNYPKSIVDAGFSLDVVPSLGFDKSVIICVLHCKRQRNLLRKVLCVPLSALSLFILLVMLS